MPRHQGRSAPLPYAAGARTRETAFTRVPEYGDIPAEAAACIRKVRAAIGGGDFAQLRGHLAEEFVWSAGGDPSADQAIIMWRADPTLASQLAAAFDAGCAGAKGDLVTCPGQPLRRQRAVTLARVEGVWRLTSFVPVE